MNWRRALGELAVFSFYVLVAIVVTWPLATNLQTAVADLGDPLLNAWIVDWDLYALTHRPLHIFSAPMFYPSKYPLAYSESLIGVAIACLPFYLLGLSPLTIYNIALLLGFAFSAYAAYVLTRLITGHPSASLMAGTLYGFVTFKFAHLAHLQIIWSAWPALLLAAFLAYRRHPSMTRAALVAGAFVMSGLTNIYFFLFGAVALALTLALLAIAERHDRRFWITLGGALAAGMLVLAPFLWPYQVVSKLYDMKRGVGETLGGSATPFDWLVPSGRSYAYGDAFDPALRQSERELFPGLLLLLFPLFALALTPPRADPPPVTPPSRKAPRWLDVLIILLAIVTYFGAITDRIRIVYHRHVLLTFSSATIAATLLTICVIVRLALRFPRGLGDGNIRTALLRSRFSFEMWAAALWIVVGFVGSLGLNTFFYSFLFHHLPGFRSMRAPARWAMIAYAGLAVWAAAGMASLLRSRRWRIVPIAALVLLDIWPKIQWEHTLVDVAPVDRWIADNRAGPLFELPIQRVYLLYQYLQRAMAHHQPLFNGMSGFEPPLHRRLREQPLDDVTLDVLERNGCRFVLLRPDWAGRDVRPIYEWLRCQLDRGRLAFVRKFEYSMNGDWLFALTRVERDWQRFRVPAARDPAGFTADEQMARLLDGEQVYSGTTFAHLSQPKPFEDIKGPMVVAGWAISPYGLRSVTVLVANGRYRFPAGLFERADVTQHFPWYPRTPRPAFAVAIPSPPKRMYKYTDVQIEIVDGRGVKTLLPDVLITWRH